MNQFTQEEMRNILVLINTAPINGQQALTVALLQQKLAKMITAEEQKAQVVSEREKMSQAVQKKMLNPNPETSKKK